HGGERRHAELGNSAARKEIAVDLDLGSLAGADLELVRARDTAAVEQRVHDEVTVGGLRPHQPEIGEGRELLATLRAGVDRQPSSRYAVVLVAAENTEIRGAEKHVQLILVARGL